MRRRHWWRRGKRQIFARGCGWRRNRSIRGRRGRRWSGWRGFGRTGKRIQTGTPRPLNDAGVAFQDLLQVLGKGGAGEDHVAAGFVGLLLEFALHVRQKADHADAFIFGAGFQLADDFERVDGFEIQIEDDQRGLGFGFDQNLVFILDEFYGHADALGGIVDLDGKEKIADNGQNFLASLLHTVRLQQFLHRQTPSWPGLWTRLKSEGRPILLGSPMPCKHAAAQRVCNKGLTAEAQRRREQQNGAALVGRQTSNLGLSWRTWLWRIRFRIPCALSGAFPNALLLFLERTAT